MQKEYKRLSPSELVYSFKGELWKAKGPGGWHFVTLPSAVSTKIRRVHANSEEGWGRLKTRAKIKRSCWETAIWFDRKANSYMLPVKAVIRKKEKLEVGAYLGVRLEFKSERW